MKKKTFKNITIAIFEKKKDLVIFLDEKKVNCACAWEDPNQALEDAASLEEYCREG